MTQIEQAWGAGPSARYEDLAKRFRHIFAHIRETAVTRDIDRSLPHEEIGWLRAAKFTKLRVPTDEGGLGATLPELFNLLIELSAADPNVTNALRSHFGFTEDILVSPFPAYRQTWLKRIARGDTAGSGHSETGDAKVTAFSTRLIRQDDHWLLNGKKYYTTGSLFADWINLAAADEAGEVIGAQVPTQAPGVTILDDWNGFGQALTASGTVIFKDVVITEDLINPSRQRFRYSIAFFQLVHLATLAGIARAATDDVSRLVSERRRIYSHGNADSVAADPQILQVVGTVRSAAYSAGAIVLKAAESVQRAHEAYFLGDADGLDAAIAIADLEIDQAVTTVTDLVLDATTRLFDALGASAADRNNGLDRHWRNARTITSHNPRIYRSRIVGDFAVNGKWPPGAYRVGEPVSRLETASGEVA
jgi:alkylation response protein AidB-like acyl-CoA dehydrogenase